MFDRQADQVCIQEKQHIGRGRLDSARNGASLAAIAVHAHHMRPMGRCDFRSIII